MRWDLPSEQHPSVGGRRDVLETISSYHHIAPLILAREARHDRAVAELVLSRAIATASHAEQRPAAARLRPWVAGIGHRLFRIRFWKASTSSLPDRAATGQELPFTDAPADAATVDQMETSGTHEQMSRPLPPVPHPILTPREQEILTLLCQRRTNAEMAATLFLSPRTIETHVARVIHKLGATNRREAAALAVRGGFVPPVPVQVT